MDFGGGGRGGEGMDSVLYKRSTGDTEEDLWKQAMTAMQYLVRMKGPGIPFEGRAGGTEINLWELGRRHLAEQ